MKKFLLFIFLPILFFQFSNCKPAGNGQLVITLEIPSEKTTQDVQQKVMEIVKQRLTGIGIEEKDIAITSKENRFELIVSEKTNYPEDIQSKIFRILAFDGKVALWETYSVSEIASALSRSMNAIDSANGVKRFQELIAINPVFQEGKACDLGAARAADTSMVNRFMDSLITTNFFPHNFRYLWSDPRLMNNQMLCSMILVKTEKNDARMSGLKFDDVKLIKANGADELTFFMSGFDADEWKKMTRENVGRAIAITIDGTVYTWPTVNGEIGGGVFSITGPGDHESFERLYAVTKPGGFPVPVRMVQSQVRK
jgi:hypothetical protein